MIEHSRNILEVSNLTVGFKSGQGISRAVDGVSFGIRRGELLALVGESGSGKSVTSLALMGLLPEETAVIEKGQILFDGINLLTLSPDHRRAMRGKRMSMVFQEPMTALNPVLSIGWQIREVLMEHEGQTTEQARKAAIDLLEQVGIPSAEKRYGDYPHQLSGGMRQRVMIAMALACKPELLIADEPTTALDVTVQAQIMDLLNRLRQRLGTAVLFITHNLALVREQADRVAVMVSGQMVETAPTEELFRNPRHPYTRLLLRSVPRTERRGLQLATIAHGEGVDRKVEGGCAFAPRCPHAQETCWRQRPLMTEISALHSLCCHLRDSVDAAAQAAEGSSDGTVAESPREVLKAHDLRVWFPVRKGLFGRVTGQVKAVDGVDLCLQAGETLALVGESGCGKTTVGKALVRLLKPTGGQILMSSQEDLATLSLAEMVPYRRRIQMIFQDPKSSLDPRLMVGESLREGLLVHEPQLSLEEGDRRIAELLTAVGMEPAVAVRYPNQFSGGQLQRIGVARALSMNPEIIVCDECTSALDVSVQAQILNLLRRLQAERGLAYLFITHDLSVVSYFADRVAVMYLGRIVEEGMAEDVFRRQLHPYTQALLSAAPQVDETDGRKVLRLEGDVPSPLAPPSGCHFHPRCPFCEARCMKEEPPQRVLSGGHRYVCWREANEEDGDRQ